MIYAPAVLALLVQKIDVRAVTHITGGGIPGNLGDGSWAAVRRHLDEGTAVVLVASPRRDTVA